MWSRGCYVRVAKATKNMDMGVTRWRAKQGLMGGEVAKSGSWEKVNEISRSVQFLNPEGRREPSLREKGAKHVHNRANHAFGMAVLLRGVRTGEAREDAV